MNNLNPLYENVSMVKLVQKTRENKGWILNARYQKMLGEKLKRLIGFGGTAFEPQSLKNMTPRFTQEMQQAIKDFGRLNSDSAKIQGAKDILLQIKKASQAQSLDFSRMLRNSGISI